VSFGQLEKGPDGKIYMANVYDTDFPNITFDSLNRYIGVINFPDSIGLSCNFEPYSIYLGGRRSFYNLPVHPNYELGPVVGSICDSLTSEIEIEQSGTNFNYYIDNEKVLHIKFCNPTIVKYTIQIFDANGKLTFFKGESKNKLSEEQIHCENLGTGIYFIRLEINENIYAFKIFVK